MPKHTEISQHRPLIGNDSRLVELETENDYLKTLVRRQAEIITELECRVDPYSPDGEALCDSFWKKNWE
jgi:hypothetical protein